MPKKSAMKLYKTKLKSKIIEYIMKQTIKGHLQLKYITYKENITLLASYINACTDYKTHKMV